MFRPAPSEPATIATPLYGKSSIPFGGRAMSTVAQYNPHAPSKAKMSRQVYINGKLVPAEQATVSVYDHGLLYGDGVFEGSAATAARSSGWTSISTGCGIGQGHLAESPDVAARNGQGDRRHARRQRHQGRLHPRGGHPRRRHAGARPQPLQQSAGHHHRRLHQPLSARVLRERPGNHHRSASATIRRRSARGSSRSTT